jgi:L-alanine-DL-glutamate epimerase-like enolase superfamily enzyme
MPRCTFGVESHGGPETDPLHYGLFHEHPHLQDGKLIISDKPGFGLEIDWGFVAKYAATGAGGRAFGS